MFRATLLFQVALRSAQVVHFHFQFADDHLKTIQLDPLKGFHALFQTPEKALQDLTDVSLRSGMHGLYLLVIRLCDLLPTLPAGLPLLGHLSIQLLGRH
jgi:hypothetical protein